MGWGRGWSGWTLACVCVSLAGCGSWTLRQHGTTSAAPPPQPSTYSWQQEGQCPAPPPVAPAAASADASPSEPGPTYEIPPTAGLSSDASFSVESLPARGTVATPANSGGVPGYRIQVFASRAREAAETLRDELTTQTQSPVYLDSEPPFFKVRVGDCESEAACQALQEELRGAGYASAFTVPARIVSP